MNQILIETREGLKGDRSHQTIRMLAEATVHWVKPLAARAAAVINGELKGAQPAAAAAPQDAIDALFDHKVETVWA